MANVFVNIVVGTKIVESSECHITTIGAIVLVIIGGELSRVTAIAPLSSGIWIMVLLAANLDFVKENKPYWLQQQPIAHSRLPAWPTKHICNQSSCLTEEFNF